MSKMYFFISVRPRIKPGCFFPSTSQKCMNYFHTEFLIGWWIAWDGSEAMEQCGTMEQITNIVFIIRN